MNISEFITEQDKMYKLSRRKLVFVTLTWHFFCYD